MAETFLSGPEFDQPIYHGHPRITYMICSTGRSGSTLLCSLLTNTGVMGVPHEYFNLKRHGSSMIKRYTGKVGELPIDKYFDLIIQHRTTPNGVFSIKAHINQALPYLRNGFIGGYFGPMKNVLIRRKDVLGQAISLVIADQTGKWTSHEEQAKEPVYSYEQIEKAVRVSTHYDGLWDHFFQLNKIEPCLVYYETLLERPQEEIQRVIDFVGVDAKVEVKLQDAGLKREATNVNREWRERFEEDSKKAQA